MTEQTQATPEVRRPYAPPCIVVHGTVQDLTQGKSGPEPDLDGTGSAFVTGQ
jgi:hypothetical protein